MPPRKVVLLALTLLSCHLTLAASGDDFCLWRLVCPASLAQADRLPLDDPNTDFTAGELAVHRDHAPTKMLADLPVIGSAMPRFDRASLVAGPGTVCASHPQPAELRAPLRC